MHPMIEAIRRAEAVGYAWIITRDRLTPSGKFCRKGTQGPSLATPADLAKLQAGEGRKFRMLDDDGEVYYEGRIIGDEGAETDFGPLDDFGTPDAGCTSIQYRVKGQWVQL